MGMRMRKKNKSVDVKFNYSYRLAKINEENSECSGDEDISHRKKGKILLPKLNEHPLENLNFYETWMYKLSKNPQVFKYFVRKAIAVRVLRNLRSESFDGFSSDFSRNLSNLSNLSGLTRINSERYESLENLNDSGRNSVNKETKNHIPRVSVIVNSAITSLIKGISLHKLLSADKSTQSYIDRFKDITGTSNNLTRENLREYLNKRYAAETSESIIKWIYPGMSSNIENWILNMQKFVTLPDEKHLKFAFDLYDINKDHFICNSDAFNSILLDRSRNFTQDIIAITNKLEEKLKNDSKLVQTPQKTLTPVQQLRLIHEEKKLRLLPIYKPDALNFDEFVTIRFSHSKPKVLIDVVEYVSGIEILETQTKVKTQRNRKNSEEIVREISESYKVRDEIQQDKDHKYFLELFSEMKKLGMEKAFLVLEKFNLMVCKEYGDLALVSMNSVKSAWPGIFVEDNEFVNFSFYQFLAGYENRDITKLAYLKKLQILFDVSHN